MKANFRKNWDFEDWKEEKGQTEFIFLMRAVFAEALKRGVGWKFLQTADIAKLLVSFERLMYG